MPRLRRCTLAGMVFGSFRTHFERDTERHPSGPTPGSPGTPGSNRSKRRKCSPRRHRDTHPSEPTPGSLGTATNVGINERVIFGVREKIFGPAVHSPEVVRYQLKASTNKVVQAALEPKHEILVEIP